MYIESRARTCATEFTMASKLLIIILTCCLGFGNAARLSVSGTDLMYNGVKVYLSGVNAAWNNYGWDFGNGNYDGTLEQWIADIGASGGNAFRVWVHIEGYNTPIYDSDGMVTACDSTGNFINDVIQLLDAAQAADVLVILTLWNGAVLSNSVYRDMIMDDAKLESYLTNCLTSFAQAVAGHPALGAWEAINEGEGSIAAGVADSNPCYDTTTIANTGVGWTGSNIPMERMQHFIGRINQVVHENDPTGLVTLGSGINEQTNVFPSCYYHWSDECLNGAAGGTGAHIDFHQMHTYEWEGAWIANTPFLVDASDYQVSKPIVIGEFSSACAAGMTMTELHEYGYTHGYTGTWTWHWAGTGDCSDTREDQRAGLSVLVDRTDNGLVDFDVN